ncbi:MAG: N-acetylmuramoyl-L-alanine amidase [Pelovirga sp.]
MKIVFFVTFLQLLLFFPVVDSGQAQGKSYVELRQDYQQLITSAQLQRQRTNWKRLISNFDRFIAQRSRDPYIENARFLRARTWDGLAQASGGRSDAEEAIRLYLDLTSRFPDSRFADDALFHAGEIAQQRLNDQNRAIGLYRRVIRDTPSGDMVPEAHKKLAALSVAVPPEKVTTKVEQHQYEEVAQAPLLQSIRYWSGPEYTRIVLDLSAPVVANPNFLSGDSPRLYFDLVYTDLADQLPDEIVINNGLVERVRASRFDTQRSRVVIDLERELEYRITNLDSPHRLVVDIVGAPSRTPQVQIARPPSSSPIADDSIADILGSATSDQPVMRIRQQSNGDGIRLIVVDPGHGGRDPGAIGPSGTREKDVNLAMAKILAAALRQQLGVKVLLTREDDRYLELRERTEYANRVGADLFISLHANATTGSRAYGVETYFLNLSKTNEAAEVAARENGMTLQDISNLEAILFDLMANAKINESSRLAAEVQQSLVAGLSSRYSNIRDLGVKQGPFHVLLGATMPSALVESAFITNPREEKRLKSVDYQRYVANSIVQGVKKYAAAMGQVAWK